jgi:reactive intermediate/imine deaminase
MSQSDTVIHTDQAPKAIGPYSQARRLGQTVYLSGQIPIKPKTGEVILGDFSSATRQVFDNLKAVAEASGGSLQDIVKLNIYVTDLGHFQTLNAIMMEYFSPPYPARAAVEVAALPKGVEVEMDGILVLP